MIGPLQLVLAFFLDLAIGDPRWLPHPVRILGRCITGLESLLRPRPASRSAERRAGVFLVLLILLPTFLITFFILIILFLLPGTAGNIIGMAIAVYITATTLAGRELISSAKSVISDVRDGNITRARLNLGMIVGRDTQNLPANEILKAVMETLAENLSDGFIAPLFYLAIGGLPLAMVYKAANTLDSMVGYKNDTYRDFGWAAARFDDIANYLPARLTGVLISVAFFSVMLYKNTFRAFAATRYSLTTMFRDGSKHPSPNSGIPEAAMAGALGIRMGGPTSYGGIVVDKPYIGEARTKETAEDYLAASEMAVAVSKITVLLGITFAVFILLARRVQ